ncbi:carbohydrate ABC transporter membrane protein 2 (CUT1 family) [Aliiruegeria haliotis]|uniref:Carbohydrate ABC transporter membrane protein 2 (CUT1 family) n=1 Tax=Aliiruegeria haliotis TaxID=1280846 RepID=A0A2T0RLW3_9RHOB|nr:carbohydrate ABC transporter permease [Aliiruegeria haliotis]PRY22186.1 carbohydrate ABC transporter membrane protein 2 (CUT1 family) [Aliiruegeria haliotis]
MNPTETAAAQMVHKGPSHKRIRLITRVCWTSALLVVAVPFVFPFLWMVSSSLKSAAEIFGAPSLIPDRFLWSNFVEVFNYQPFARHYFNSIYISLSVTGLTLIIASLAGYALARMRFAGAGLIMLFLVSGLMVPEEVTIIPNFFLVRWLGLMDTHAPLILLPTFGSHGVMATFLMRQYFVALPKELEEAGTMDGLSRLGVWWKIALPMSRPALGAVAIITFLFSWNLFLEPLVFLSSLEKFTLPLSLANFTDAYGMPLWHLQLAATTLAVVPVLTIYVLAQRQIIESFALSGVKG